MVERPVVWHANKKHSVGRAVSSNTIGQWFEPIHWRNSYRTFVFYQLYWRDDNKKKRPEMALLKTFNFLKRPISASFCLFSSPPQGTTQI